MKSKYKLDNLADGVIKHVVKAQSETVQALNDMEQLQNSLTDPDAESSMFFLDRMDTIYDCSMDIERWSKKILKKVDNVLEQFEHD